MRAVLSLFDYTGAMVEPWVDAGYEAWIVDTQHPPGITTEGRLHKVNADLREPWTPPDRAWVFVAAFPPCTALAVSGSRWMRGKGLRALSESIAMFATAAEVCDSLGAPYIIENPVSTISTYWRKPDYTFHPWQFSLFCPDDTYTKQTCLWTGNGFVMPDPAFPPDIVPDDRIHKAPPAPDRANFRSATPRGFARAVFEANNKEQDSE